jgi:hypothetical protein
LTGKAVRDIILGQEEGNRRRMLWAGPGSTWLESVLSFKESFCSRGRVRFVLETAMVRLTATNLPSPAPPYLLEIGEISGDISWDRRGEIEPVLVEISLIGLPHRDISELTDAYRKLGSYRKVSVRLVPLQFPGKPVEFSGYIRTVNPKAGRNTVKLQIEETD